MPLAPAPEHFTSRLRSPAVAARVGVWLGVCFGLCFLTGVYSHIAQLPDPWIPLPTRPTWFYRVTQGLHVTAGVASVPLLLVKLWTVYPHLFARPPRAVRELALHALERASIGVLVAAAFFQLVTGIANSAQWYPWAFSFRATHYAVGWVAIGALVVHIAVKLPSIRAALSSDIDDGGLDRPTMETAASGLSRRGLVRSALVAAGLAVVATAGSTVPALRHVSVLGVRSGDGPQGVPVNKSARAAGVLESAASADFRLDVVHGGRTVSLTRADLERLPQTTAELPIACVEGWSASASWTGVRLRALLDLVGAPSGVPIQVRSLQEHGPYKATILPGNFADDDLTLLALRLDGETLDLDHGYPCRLIAPNRPGVLQTKWVTRLEVSG
jgi:hypothetical protein